MNKNTNLLINLKKKNILAHRGLWSDFNLNKNSFEALSKALELGYGIETDIRDGESNIEIRHDPFEKGWDFEELLKFYKKNQFESFLALNIKSDGLSKKLKYLLDKYQIINYFTFDMSIPDHIQIDNYDLKNLIRLSEYEKSLHLFPNSVGFWIDPFSRETKLDNLISKKFIKRNTKLVFVSPELHENNIDKDFINFINNSIIDCGEEAVFICTDYPDIYS